MTRGSQVPVTCREDGCETRLIFASRGGRRLPYEAESREPFTDHGFGAHVLIGDQAMTVREAIEHFQTRGAGCDEEKARDLVAGFPAHRAHFHTPRTTDEGERP